MSNRRNPYSGSQRRNYNNRNRGGGRGRRGYSGPKKYEDYAWQLDFLPAGYIDDPRPRHLRDPILQVLGERYFSLLEIILDRRDLDDFEFEPSARIFIGRGEENKIAHRVKRIYFDKLSLNAKGEITRALEAIIEHNPERFLNFFNHSQPITNRMHQLELLPGIGKKTMWAIIDARKKKLFESFEDIQERTSITNPKSLIVKRIMKELEDRDEKHLLFVRQ
ncbi:DUF655 domain-containing protein [Candidatus Bathyarchaeota archaeon]|nr:DUF655 domain-containing protein [Candidatus Bathyarchaeota archaeon]